MNFVLWNEHVFIASSNEKRWTLCERVSNFLHYFFFSGFFFQWKWRTLNTSWRKGEENFLEAFLGENFPILYVQSKLCSEKTCNLLLPLSIIYFIFLLSLFRSFTISSSAPSRSIHNGEEHRERWRGKVALINLCFPLI